MWKRLSSALLATGLLIAPTGWSANAAEDESAVGERLSNVQTRLDAATDREKRLAREAEALTKESGALRRQLIAVARQTQAREAAVTRLETSLQQLRSDEAAARAHLSDRKSRLTDSTASLVSLVRRPPAVLALGVQDPSKSVRQALLVRAAVGALVDDVDRGRRQIAALDRLRLTIDQKQKALIEETARLGEERDRLRSLTEAKAAMARKTEAEHSEARLLADKLASQAQDLRDLLKRLEDARQRRAEAEKQRQAEESERRQAALTPPPPPTPPSFLGRLPAQGRIVERFGQKTPEGSESKGIRIETRDFAQITAPADGTVVFAGPFRRYGQLLILEHGAGYHILLSGMTRIDAAVGDQVRAGEPVGEVDSQGGAPPSLYVELRREGRPINPVPWLTALRARING